jgi:hypothetical protein
VRRTPRTILGRTSPGRRRRLGAGAALAVAAAVVGGSAGVLLAVVAMLLVLDAVVPMPGATWSDADERFWRLVRARRRAARRRRLRGLEPERLDVLGEDGWASTAERRPLGVQTIPIESVTGTVEASKARTFDRAWRPDRSDAQRWKGLWLAQARGGTPPPIAVYRIGAAHVVRDGHHRVSVARDRGFATIDADVVELRPARAAQRPSPASQRARRSAPGGSPVARLTRREKWWGVRKPQRTAMAASGSPVWARRSTPSATRRSQR